MSNNVMWLVCKATGDKIAIAKYYPTTGWHPLPWGSRGVKLANWQWNDNGEWFELVESHRKEDDLRAHRTFGPTDFELEFDSPEMLPRKIEPAA